MNLSKAPITYKAWYTLFTIPLITFTLSYLYLAFYHRQAWLGPVIIHENGRLTLWQSIFYYEHFLAQVPQDIVLSFFIAGSFRLFSPASLKLHSRPSSRKRRVLLGGCSLLLLLFSLGATAWDLGWPTTWQILAQYKENDMIFHFGGNWRLSFTANVCTLFLSLAAAIFCTIWITQKPAVIDKSQILTLGIGVGVLIALAFIFSVDQNTFYNTRYIMHNVREIVTNLSIILPLTLGLLWIFHEIPANPPPRPEGLLRQLLTSKWFMVSCITSAGIVGYHLTIGFSHSVALHAQQPSFSSQPLPIAYLFAAHYFEHCLDYCLICLLSLLLIPTRPTRTFE